MDRLNSMPDDEKHTLLKELNDKIDAYNKKKGKRVLFLDSIGGLGAVAGIAGAAGGAALAMQGETMERLEIERLEGEMRSMKFRMMMKMGQRTEEINNFEIKVFIYY